MSRASKRSADIGFAAIAIEGGLIAPDQLLAIATAAPDAKLANEYGCPKGTNLRDEITRYFRIAQAHWQAYARIEQPTMKQTADFARSLLEQAFGFSLNGPHHHHRDDRRYLIAWEAKGGRVPVVVAPPPPAEKGRAGDGFARALPEFGDGDGGRIQRRSPTVLLQDWLNANPDFYWGLVFAGDRVRLMRDNASFTRPAWIEADLGAILKNDMFADFAALWLLIHASRFGAEGAPASDCALERWREAGQRAGTAAREKLRGNVEEALLALGQGLLEANPALRDRLDRNELTLPQLFEQMLRVVYRLIFLGVAEDRDLLHTPGTPRAVRELYANNYGFAWLRDRSSRRAARDHHHDAWETVKIVFRSLERGEKMLGLPALGGLFDRNLNPDLDAAQIPNRYLLKAAFCLAWLVDGGRRVRINWRDMATEELGSVYEGLLELVPARSDGGRGFTFAGGAEARGNARKISSSYYTPDSLVQCLLDSALNPVLERAEAEGGTDAILDLKIIDPACGSGHFLLGAARRMATRVAQLRNPDAPDYNAAMRDVVRRCVHGVDRNPMAVELAKVALWIESVEPGKPLGFLDANVQCGDSLLGIFDLKALDEGIPDDAYKPLTGDDKDTAKYFAKRNKDEKKGQGTLDFAGGGGSLPPARLAASMDDLRLLPEDSVAQIAEKRRHFAQWQADPRRYATKVACDLYIAAFLLPKTGGVPVNANSVMVPTTAHLRTRLGGGSIYGPLEGAAIDAAEFARAFHWPLAFPEVMIGRGGFDVVLGNPPWDVVQTDDTVDVGLYDRQKEIFKLEQFKCISGRRDLYKLFLVRSSYLARKNGRFGLLIPVGFMLEEDSLGMRQSLWSRGAIDRIYYFQNSLRVFFDSVDSRYRFAIVSYTATDKRSHWFSPLITAPSNNLDDSIGVYVVDNEFERFKIDGYYGEIHTDKNSLLLHRALIARVCQKSSGRFDLTAEWHATTHKRHSVSPDTSGAVPVGKNRDVHQYNENYAEAEFYVSDTDALIRASEKEAILAPPNGRLLVRDIARSDDTVTLISSYSERKVSSYDTPAVKITGINQFDFSRTDALFLQSYLNSRIADTILRPFVDKHIKGYVLSRLPTPAIDRYSLHYISIVEKSERLMEISTNLQGAPVWADKEGADLLISIERHIAAYFSISDDLLNQVLKRARHLHS